MQLLKWLQNDCGAKDVRAAKITIGKTTYDAAFYQQTYQTPEHSPAWRRGERSYVRQMLYVIGALPACYKRSRKTCFRLNSGHGTLLDWYVAGYCPAATANDPKFRGFNPFGETFLLSPWLVPDGTSIDAHEPKPYRRVEAIVQRGGKLKEGV